MSTNPLAGRLRMSDVEMSSRQQRRPAAPGDPLGSDDLAGLLSLVARGDTGAYQAVYDQVVPVVFGAVRRVLRDPAQSEEVAQEVLVQIWRCASRYDPAQGSPTAWICTIAHRRAVDRVRAISGPPTGNATTCHPPPTQTRWRRPSRSTSTINGSGAAWPR